jgi:hypothetical protein
MARLKDVVLDCDHPASLARFWAAVLDDYEILPYDDEEIARLQSLGYSGPEDDPGVIVQGPPGSPRFYCQLVPEGKAVKNRCHVDLASDDVQGEAARLEALGAVRLDHQPDDGGWVAMADPAGNEFCLVPSV